MISIDVGSSPEHRNSNPMFKAPQEPMMKMENSFFSLLEAEEGNSFINQEEVSQRDNAKACLFIMETSNYAEIMDDIAEHDLMDYKKATAFDLF